MYRYKFQIFDHAFWGLVESMSFYRRVVGSNPALAATLGP